jgi:hypothetical protein
MFEKASEIMDTLFERDGLEVIAQKNEKELQLITDAVAMGEERFAFVVDLVGKKLTHAIGISEWLGVSNETFSLKNYFQAIHPQFVQHLILMAATSFEVANSDDFELTFNKKYITQIPLRNSRGEYLFCKRTLSVFSISQEKSGRRVISSYLNDFVIISEFDETQDLQGMAAPRITEGNNRDIKFEENIKSKAQERFEAKSTTNPYSTQEIRILKRYAQNDASAIEIAKAFKIEKNTVYTLNRRILEKTERVYNVKFEKAIDVAKYLKMEGLL